MKGLGDRRVFVRFLLLMVLALLAGVGGGCRRGPGGRVKAAVSVHPLYDLTRRVAGPDADVVLVVPPGKDIVGFAPGAEEHAVVAGARLGIAVGLGLDPWFEGLMAEGAPQARLLKAGDRVPTLPNPRGEGSDPYVWLDPRNAMLITKAIAEELARLDGPHASGYRERAAGVVASLEALDREIEEATKAFSSRAFVPFRADFGYFAERYGLTVAAVIQPSPDTPPDDAHLEEVRKVMEENKVRALFREPQVPPGPVLTLAAKTNLPVQALDPLGGGPGTETYEALLRANVASLANALR